LCESRLPRSRIGRYDYVWEEGAEFVKRTTHKVRKQQQKTNQQFFTRVMENFFHSENGKDDKVGNDYQLVQRSRAANLQF